MKKQWDWSKEKDEEQIKMFLNKYGYTFKKDDYFDLVDFLKYFGFTVWNATRLSPDEDGFLVVRSSNSDSKMIGVNSMYSLEQKRYIAAYEFAYFIFHYKIGTTCLHRKNKNYQEENEIKHFAVSLLMPKEPFLRIYIKLKGTCLNDTMLCLQLASIFKVPIECVQYRIHELFSHKSYHTKSIFRPR